MTPVLEYELAYKNKWDRVRFKQQRTCQTVLTKVTGYGKQTEWRVSIVTSSSNSMSLSNKLPLPPAHHTYSLTALNRDSAYQLEVESSIYWTTFLMNLATGTQEIKISG